MAGPTRDQKIAGNQDNITGGYKLAIYADKAEFEIRDSGNTPITNRFIEGGTLLEPGTWYHVVGTYSQGGSIKTYVNAKLDREQETLNILAPSSGTLKIGREPFSNLYWFNGFMDDLQIYSYPLSGTEVAALYTGGEPPILTAKSEILTATGDKQQKSNYWIPALGIVIIAAVAISMTVRKGKTTA